MKTGKYFGTDGFRGEAGSAITAEHAYKAGRVIGWYFGARIGARCRAVIGKDTRLSSYMLEYSIAAGLTASGADAYIMHVTTTASVSYIARCDGFDCGIMISASHNAYADNGIKLINSQGEKLTGELIALIESYFDGDFIPFGGVDIPFARGEKIGRTVDYVSGRNRYIGHLIALSTCSYKSLKVGLDGANGSAFNIARSVFDALGAKTRAIGCSPDGTNVNRNVGSTNIGALSELTVAEGLDIGFAFDGDADRCIAVDERGRELTGDEILYICAEFLKERGELNKNLVVCTVMSNGGLKKSLEAAGIGVEICGVGDSEVYATMAKTGAVLGGERSGHVVFSKYESTGDGLVTAIMIMEALVEKKCPVSELVKGYKALPQVTVSVPTDDKKRAASEVRELAFELSRRLNVRIIVRPSGTENAVRIMAEGEDEKICGRVCEILTGKIAENLTRPEKDC